MGMLDEPDEMFSPKSRYKSHDNTNMLNQIGEDCYTCLNPMADCTCPEE